MVMSSIPLSMKALGYAKGITLGAGRRWHGVRRGSMPLVEGPKKKEFTQKTVRKALTFYDVGIFLTVFYC